MTNNNRFPAEWEPQDTVILSWPHPDTDWNYMLDEAKDCFLRIAKAILPYANVLIVSPEGNILRKQLAELVENEYSNKIYIIECDTNDTWARDFGFISTIDSEGSFVANDFKFNGWGLKFPANFDNLINLHLLRAGALCAKYQNRLNFALEGGSIDTDGIGTILTTSRCLLSPNRNGEFSKHEIEERLKEYLNCDRVLWIEHGDISGDDTDGHIDTLARFLPGNIIAYASCDNPNHPDFVELSAMDKEIQALTDKNGNPYRLVPLPVPNPQYDEDGNIMPATYANFLLINGALLLPIYADAKYDDIAIKRLSDALPDYEIVPVDCRALIHQHGSLHCVTMQAPKGALSL